ncbi:MAG: hypothetical protein LBO74_13095 [Candidatus Symbiothrix sp.]|jgi:predicted AAA+ superfamily ATPase|nr:hypothetical protein [Candidatus Symbiothrix sp.]
MITFIISPRRWGKTSLVNKVSETLRKENPKEITICNLDIFNCRTEEQFYKAYANAILKSSLPAWEKFVAGETNFSSKEVLRKYDLGSSANIKNLKKATLEKDLIDILPDNQIVLQDPAFEYWLKNDYGDF